MRLTGMLVGVVVLAAVFGWIYWSRRRREQLFLEAHSIEAEQLYELLFRGRPGGDLQLIDVRQPLDLLAYSQIIPGARRISPKEIIANPELISKEADTIVYCTCPSDATSRMVAHRAAAFGYDRVRILRGGLGAWKAKSFPVEAYETAFHLDTAV